MRNHPRAHKRRVCTGSTSVGLKPPGTGAPGHSRWIRPANVCIQRADGVRSGRGKGIAHRLHDELLSLRSESRATLLVRPENDAANAAYYRWGWQKVAQLQPGWEHAPRYDDLILPLRPEYDVARA
jgi:hypothetical protein